MKPFVNNSLPIFWKYFFLTAGLYNGIGCGAGMVFPGQSIKIITGLDTAEPAVLLVFFLLSFVVSMFGLGYALVAFNASFYRGFVTIGAIGKMIFFVVVIYSYLNGFATLFFVAVTIGDFIWAGFFVHYLRTSRMQSIALK